MKSETRNPRKVPVSYSLLKRGSKMLYGVCPEMFLFPDTRNCQLGVTVLSCNVTTTNRVVRDTQQTECTAVLRRDQISWKTHDDPRECLLIVELLPAWEYAQATRQLPSTITTACACDRKCNTYVRSLRSSPATHCNHEAGMV
jgi:hypothetical protein